MEELKNIAKWLNSPSFGFINTQRTILLSVAALQGPVTSCRFILTDTASVTKPMGFNKASYIICLWAQSPHQAPKNTSVCSPASPYPQPKLACDMKTSTQAKWQWLLGSEWARLTEPSCHLGFRKSPWTSWYETGHFTKLVNIYLSEEFEQRALFSVPLYLRFQTGWQKAEDNCSGWQLAGVYRDFPPHKCDAWACLAQSLCSHTSN